MLTCPGHNTGGMVALPDDGNVGYLKGKHILLFGVAIPYTLLLTFGQCIRSFPTERRCVLKFTTSMAFYLHNGCLSCPLPPETQVLDWAHVASAMCHLSSFLFQLQGQQISSKYVYHHPYPNQHIHIEGTFYYTRISF